MSTPHNSAAKGDIAKTVLMPGDPLRAKFIAENFLENAKCFNEVRGMLGFTGTYEGKEVSVMGHGMGMPSVAIYSYELFNFYDVDNIIRIGSAGSLQDDVKVMDIVIAQGSCTDSAFADQYKLPGTYAPIADYNLLEKAVNAARESGARFHVGNVIASDVFYRDMEDHDKWRDMGVLCAEMESAALYMNAVKAKKHALAILTVSDHIYLQEELSPEERQTGFKTMMEIALKVATQL